MVISIHWRMTRGLSVSHISHSIKRNTQLLPSLAKNYQPRHSPRLIQRHQLRLSVMLKNTPTKDFFSDPGDHSHHCFHSFILMTCFVFCHQISVTRKREENHNNNKEMKGWKSECSAMNMMILKNKRSGEIRKKNNWKRTTRVEGRHWKKRGERWADATNVPWPRSMTIECTKTWLAQLSRDTQQWSRELSIVHAIPNACESWNCFFFSFFDFLLHVTYFQHLAQTWVQKRNEKRWKTFFSSNSRNAASEFLEGLNKWLFCKKRVNLSCSNERDWKEQIRKKAKQQWRQNKNSFTKSEELNRRSIKRERESK